MKTVLTTLCILFSFSLFSQIIKIDPESNFGGKDYSLELLVTNDSIEEFIRNRGSQYFYSIDTLFFTVFYNRIEELNLSEVEPEPAEYGILRYVEIVIIASGISERYYITIDNDYSGLFKGMSAYTSKPGLKGSLENLSKFRF